MEKDRCACWTGSQGRETFHPLAHFWHRLPQEAFLGAQLASLTTWRLLAPGRALHGGYVALWEGGDCGDLEGICAEVPPPWAVG